MGVDQGRSNLEVPEVEVLLPPQMEASGGQVVLAVVVVQQHLDLLHGHVQSRRLSPDLTVNASNGPLLHAQLFATLENREK